LNFCFYRFIVIAVILPLGAALAATTPSTTPEGFSAKELAQGHTDGSILALPRSLHRVSAEAAENLEGRRMIRKFARFDDLRVLAPAAGETTAEAITRLRATGRYEFVEPDYLLHVDATPNDTRFTTQWSLANTGQSNGIVSADISALAAWDTLTDASSVIVAVIDSGARLTHADLAPNLWRNPAPTIGDINGIRATSARGTITNGDPTDDEGHGSHVAGIIGAVGNNGAAGAGIAGVAWKVQIMPLKFITSAGTGATSDAVACIDYAIAHGASIINASYGESSGNFSQSQYLAIKRARDAGLIFVAAAGNETTNLDLSPHYPASYNLDNVIAIGASARRDEAAAYSNYGATVELFAPGSEILSLGYTTDTASATLSGTSMAAPHISGALALLKSRFPADSPRQLINRLLRSVDHPASLAGTSLTNGRLNLARALTSTDNRPFNDDFASRALLTSDNITARAANSGATREADEPLAAGLANGSGSLWWQWSTNVGGTVSISTTADSTFDTVLAVYTGTTLATLTPVAFNDDAPGGTNSRVTFSALPGVKYQIAVEGKNGATGFMVLDIATIPANDAFANALTLTGPTALIVTTNKGASRESGEPRILNNAGGTSLWYQWTAPATGRYQFAVYSNDVDPFLAVYTGSSLSNLNLVAANDSDRADSANTSALVTIEATAGITYRIAIDAKSGTGSITLTLNDTLWQAAATDSITPSPTVAPDGTVYAGSADKILYAFNPDGSQKWAYLTTGTLDSASAALGSDGTLYVGSNDSIVYALKPDGSLLWSQSLDLATRPGASNSIALAADGTLYLKASDGYVYALNPADGSRKWRTYINGPDASHYGSPSIAADGTIYCGSSDNSLYALNPDGSKKWTFTPATADGGIYSPPALDTNGNLYFSTLTGAIYCVSATGTQRWRFTSGGNCTSSPALSADGTTLYYGGYDKKLYALATATGAPRWTAALGDEVRASSPAIDANGVIYIGCYDKKLYAINPDGSLKRTWATSEFIRSSPAIAGTTLYIGSGDHKLYAINLGVSVAGGPWPQYRANARRLGRAVTETLAIIAEPSPIVATAGTSASFSVTATGTGPLAYQWFKAGVALTGATNATLDLPAVTTAQAGSYTVRITGPQGSVTSAAALLTVNAAPAGLTSRLSNVSVLATLGANQIMIVGVNVLGEAKPILLRAAGPSLTVLNVAGAMTDPHLTLYNGPNAVAFNEDWAGNAEVVAANAAFTGFPFSSSTSRDAAIVSSINGGRTLQVAGPAAGIVLVEAYDAGTGNSSRLNNLSARNYVGTGANILIAGFTLTGSGTKTILIRAVGARLATAPFNLTGVLADPKLALFNSASEKIAENDTWSSSLTSTFSAVGAFSLTTGSKDAALLVTLNPGGYTVQVSGANATTGQAIVEIYEVP